MYEIVTVTSPVVQIEPVSGVSERNETVVGEYLNDGYELVTVVSTIVEDLPHLSFILKRKE